MNLKFNHFLFCIISISLIGSYARSNESVDLDNVTLEDLLDARISVATKNETSLRATPSVVSVITEDDIRLMGARDLIDVLRTIPSFHFAYDVQGVVGLGVRGLWAAEGKHLLIIDEIEMNELQFAGTQFGNDLPVNQIKRIEVIRGPGSAIYGGFAELSVIKITTKSGSDLKGAEVELTAGIQSTSVSRSNLSAAIGGVTDHGIEYSIASYLGKSRRGNGIYSGTAESADDNITYSGEFDFSNADTLQPKQLNIGLAKGGLKLRGLYNQHIVNTHTMFGMTKELGRRGAPNEFESLGVHAVYEYKVSDKTRILPQVMWLQQSPWKQTDEVAIAAFERSHVTSYRLRPTVNMSTSWNIGDTDTVDLLFGVEQNFDHHHIVDRQGWNASALERLYFYNGSNDARISSTAAYAQAIYKTGPINVTLGARYEAPSETNSSFVPRIGITRVEKDWHIKALYSQAFRSPVIYNFEYKANERIFPETSETVELEMGHAVSTSAYLSANIYDTLIKNPIVYTVDTNEQYENFEKTGTRGAELDLRWKIRGGSLQFGYSYYQIASSNIGAYAVTGNDRAFLGMPQHSGNLNANFEMFSKNLKINPQVTYKSSIYAFAFDGTNMVEREFPAVTLVNLFITYDNFVTSGLSAGLGVFNLLDQENFFFQPYRGGHSPIPGLKAESVLRLRYNRSF